MTEPIEVGDVVQINPEYAAFGGCFMVVTEMKPAWGGVVGYVPVPTREPGHSFAFLRLETRYVERIGRAEWSRQQQD